MASVIVGIGSNVGKRRRHLSEAKTFLSGLSENDLAASSVYISEPIGPSKRDFFNAVVRLETSVHYEDLLQQFKEFERNHGRPSRMPRWSPRTIDLDIITYNDLVIQEDTLIIPHPEYRKRLFVLLPLREIDPDWTDPETGKHIDQLIEEAPQMYIRKTNVKW